MITLFELLGRDSEYKATALRLGTVSIGGPQMINNDQIRSAIFIQIPPFTMTGRYGRLKAGLSSGINR
jgi:hypothetical protein